MNTPSLWFLAVGALVLGACSSSGGPVAGDSNDVHATDVSYVIPLVDEQNKLLSRFNDKAKALGLDEIPDTVEVKVHADMEKVSDLRTYFDDKIMPAVHAPDQAMPSWGPDSFTDSSKGAPAICYKGNASGLADLIQNSSDSVFSDQLWIRGWRYKAEKHFTKDDDSFESDFPDAWKNWSSTNEDVLVIVTQGDGGDDLSPALIPLCSAR